ncbi:MAG: glucose-1-phosphate adenylyltransferase [Bacilli bacterium]|nr:glucose-1-phosphate adenylyltransferase [Bacilli bacterium]
MAVKIAAMILAGGKGTRLGALTRKLAKPAVSYGGKYRIIDFPLSNCANSGITHVGVLTQYESSGLNSYVGNGRNWGLNGVNCLTSVLSPKQTEQGSNWYRGTADAIYQNLDWLDALSPEYVLILSGDHIYATTYDAMLQQHIGNKADCTVAVRNVPLSEASRFGICETNESGFIVGFKEKPKNPKGTLASMGIYIFTYQTLRKYLKADYGKELSEHDFGKDIIPAMIARKKRLLAYRYDGYWKDVGTIVSLHQANMDLLLSGDPAINLYSIQNSAHIYSEDNHCAPQYIGASAVVRDCLINQGAMVKGLVDHCVISAEVVVEEGAECHNAVLMNGCHIHSGAKVYDCLVAPNEVVRRGETINAARDGIVLYAGGRETK